MKGFHKRGGAQWANLGGQTLQLKWLVNCKDPMHDCNRFLWQISHTGDHWTDFSKCINWMLIPRSSTHQITKYWSLKMNHPSFKLEWTTRAPSSGKKEKHLLLRLNNFILCDTYNDTQFDTAGNEEIIKYKFCSDRVNQCPSHPRQYPLPLH